MKEILTKKEILALWGVHPSHSIKFYAKHPRTAYKDVSDFRIDFTPKLEAFMEDSVSRAQIQKIHNDLKKECKLCEGMNHGWCDGKKDCAIPKAVKRLGAVLEK